MVKYKVSLNWYGELKGLYVHAKNKTHAKTLALRRFAKMMGIQTGYIKSYFTGKDNIKTEVVS